jgi:hypothetical protein
VPTLAQLESTYFPPATLLRPTYSGDTEIVPIIDGIAYLREIHGAIAACGSGDAIFILGLFVEHKMDLLGRDPAQPGFQELADLLAEKAYDGVDVRVVLAGGAVFGATGLPKVGPFRDNIVAARPIQVCRPRSRQSTPRSRASRFCAPLVRGRSILCFRGSGSAGRNSRWAVSRKFSRHCARPSVRHNATSTWRTSTSKSSLPSPLSSSCSRTSGKPRRGASKSSLSARDSETPRTRDSDRSMRS